MKNIFRNLFDREKGPLRLRTWIVQESGTKFRINRILTYEVLIGYPVPASKGGLPFCAIVVVLGCLRGRHNG